MRTPKYNWEEYTPTITRRSSEPHVRLGKTGQISFTKRAVEMYKVADYALLSFDPNKKALGIKFTDEPNPRARKVSKAARHGTATLNVKSLLDHYEIPVEESLEYEPVAVGDMLVVELAA